MKQVIELLPGFIGSSSESIVTSKLRKGAPYDF